VIGPDTVNRKISASAGMNPVVAILAELIVLYCDRIA
jgi:hypothetical protein